MALTLAEITTMRRSAAMAPLSTGSVDELLDECDRLLREREQLVAVVMGLPDSVAALREALNRLHQILHCSDASS